MTLTRICEIAARWAPPLLIPAIMLAAWQAGPATFDAWVAAPTSVMEHLLGLVLFAALATGVFVLTRSEARAYPGLRAWLAAWCLGIFYFLGEDLNWGQYIFGWQPPEFFLEHNKEGETNLHNMSSWFNQKPRQVVQIALLVAGFIVPLAWQWPKRALARFVPTILWPGRETMWLALAAVLVQPLEWALKAALGPDLGGVPIRFSEIQEFFFAWFFLLYAVDLFGRLRRSTDPVVSQAAHTHAE